MGALVVPCALMLSASAYAAAPADCEARLHTINRSSTDLHVGDVLHLEGQNVKYMGGPAQGVCDTVDRLNDPIRKKDAQIAQLKTERNMALAQISDLTRKVNEQGPLQQHVYLLFGIAVGASVFALMLMTIRFWGWVTRTPGKF
ncbi:MAG: hypothetical protein JWO84_501 [Parcubacteria group bacterium]|nr:hypothetical protein [Parcubacteria group bacterium]